MSMGGIEPPSRAYESLVLTIELHRQVRNSEDACILIVSERRRCKLTYTDVRVTILQNVDFLNKKRTIERIAGWRSSTSTGS